MNKFLFLSTFLFSSLASSGSWVQNVYVTRVHVYKQPQPAGGIFVTISKEKGNNPCSGSSSQYFIDLNEQPRGAILYSHAMSALNNKNRVTIQGSGNCEGHAKVESIEDFQVYELGFRAS